MEKKTIILTLLWVTFSTMQLLAQGNCELSIENKNSNYNLFVRMYPVSMVFNGALEGNEIRYGYNLIARKRIHFITDPPLSQNYSADFINSLYNVNNQLFPIKNLEPFNQSGSNNKFCLQHDAENLIGSAIALYGYGKYRIDFWISDTLDYNTWSARTPDNYCTIDIDAAYGIGGPAWYDLGIQWYNENDIRYQIGSFCENTPLPLNKNIEVWNPCTSHTRTKSYGNFKYDAGTTQTSNPYTVLPQDPRILCTSNYLPGAPYQNHYFTQSNDIGYLTLNLTIEKNDVNGNPVEITTPYLNLPFPVPSGAPPGIVLAGYDPLQQKGATLTLAKGTNNQERIFRFKKYNTGNYGTYLNISEKSMLELSASNIVSERSHIIFESYCNTEVEQKGIVLMRSNSMISLTGSSFMRLMPNSWLTQHTGSEIEIRDNAILMNCGAKFFVLAPIIHLYNNGKYVISNTCPLASSEPYTSEVDSGGSIILSDSASLTIEGGNKIIFDGIDSYLKVEPGTSINFGAGASIEFRNGAYLDANGCTFTSITGSEIWEGLILDGAGSQTNIQNCTFNNAVTSLSVTNTVCNISGNTFNINNNTSCVYGINAVNESNITISGNTFNTGSNSTAECIRFFNYDGDGIPGGGGSAYSLNIYDNTFNGSLNAIDIQCLTASQLPFYVAYNRFYPSSGITSNGIFAYNISGNIKNNYFYNSNSNKSFSLQFSSVNLYNNTLSSVNQNIWSSNSSIMQMAPILNELGQWVWYGGYNRLNSGNQHNIEFRTSSNPIISPNGLNCFTVTTQPNFLGELCLGSKPYKAYDNYWSPTVSGTTFDITCNNNPINITYTPNLTECPDIDPNNVTGSYVTALGNSIYDTVFVTSGGSGGSYPGTEKTIKKSSNTADILYFEAIQKRKQKDYSGAINKCKDLLNNHDTSSYFNSTLSELYLNYLESDSTGNQTITNGLFSNLKTYLEQKMQQYQSNAQFVERAYKYILMCLVKIKNYSEAIAGYENIMNNHPDPIVRLNASWDRSAVVFMMGQGGSVNELSKVNNKSGNKKLLDKNPSHKIAEKIFKDQKEEARHEEKNSELYNVDAVNMNTLKYTKEEKAIIERRIENYNPVDKKDFMNKLSNDIKLIEQINTAKTTKKAISNVPKTYKLYQNYPNPFNPTTNIKYEIPKDAEVTIKVYDLLGREVFSINEYKKAGSYEVKFDGSNLASGMYFYSFETNGFKDTKKMVLIK